MGGTEGDAAGSEEAPALPCASSWLQLVGDVPSTPISLGFHLHLSLPMKISLVTNRAGEGVLRNVVRM